MLLMQSGENQDPVDLSDPSHINPDAMSYEQLLELEEKMGKVIKGLTPSQIKAISNAFTKNDIESPDEEVQRDARRGQAEVLISG